MKALRLFFDFAGHQTSMRQELFAGLTTFLTMSYILVVNPLVLHAAHMPLAAVFIATCLASAGGCLLMGLFANLPIAVGPGMGLNVFFAYGVVLSMGYSWQFALASAFAASILFLILSATPLRRLIITSMPECLCVGISVGLGLFVMLLGLHNGQIVIANPHTLMTLGPLGDARTLLCLFGFFLLVALNKWQVPGGTLLGILIVYILGLVLGLIHYQGIVALPAAVHLTVEQWPWSQVLTGQGLMIVFTFILVMLFDSTGTLLGVLQAPCFHGHNRQRRLTQALLADSAASVFGTVLGTSPTTTFVESAAGIQAGGRTGMTAAVIGVCFLLALFLSPLVASIPAYAVAPALIYVGLLMVRNIKRIQHDSIPDFIPSVLTGVMIPFTASITDGLGLGLIFYIFLKILYGQRRDLNPVVWVLFFVYLFYFGNLMWH